MKAIFMIQLKRISINDHDKSTITINCAVDLLLGFRSRAISSCPGANRVVSFDLFSRVCHGDSITRSLARDISTTCVLSFVWRVPLCLSLSPLFSSIPISLLSRPPRKGTCVLGPFIFFSPAGALRRRARRADRCRRSHDLRNFPPGHFPRSRGFSRLAPGHYLIFRLETSHPQEKRSGWVARGGGKSGRPSGLEERSGKCFRVITFVSARTPFLSLISSQAFYLV